MMIIMVIVATGGVTIGIGGAIIRAAGLLSPSLGAPPQVYRGGNPHVRWCYNCYRSYRACDNTYQPNYGPRRWCYSPYL